MIKYKAFYKCPICGEQFESNEETSKDTVENVMFEMSVNMEAHSILAGDCYVYRYMSHNCKDGSYGLSHFQGFKICDNGAEK